MSARTPEGLTLRARLTLFAISTSFAISRAGAIAAVAANRRLHRVLPTTVRVILLVGGAITIGVGAATTIATGLGPGPFDVLVTGMSSAIGLPFAVSLWILAGVLGVISALLGKRPGPGTVLAPMIIGPMIGTMAGPLGALLNATVDALFGSSQRSGLASVASYATLGAAHVVGVVIIGFGAGAMIVSGLGAGTGDLLASATSSKLGRSMPIVRTALEVGFVGLGLTLGGPAGVGTILVALTVGPSVRFGHARVDALISHWTDSVLETNGPDTLAGRSAMQFKSVR